MPMPYRGVERWLVSCTSSAALLPMNCGWGCFKCSVSPRSVAWLMCMPITALPASMKVNR